MKKLFFVLLPLLLVGCGANDSQTSSLENTSSTSEETTTSQEPTTSSEKTEFTLTGTAYLVKDNAETPLNGLVFKLENESNKYFSSTTDSNGKFTIVDIVKGNYVLDIYIGFDNTEFTSFEVSITDDKDLEKVIINEKVINWSELS